ncbi:LexA family transcriptional regulator [Propionivibrio dicarboxylicus]|uniref:Phage repressor protein C, contains Cro/C1-type HTH and peptisase s24 domains n=1 Tax=Propionivibrio dicarboxylicus TaxID=83767 RepID=A0A1G8ARX7_9RHOO|nr:LexA family transcriptional regulator [Propionivibrio dicarboxylicus]SDH23725.1 Phage repressor protein C, contains Cro/C1-type HTH and peptisase s24 domains [Propionivibrio dicarboxylicus]
MNSTNQDNESLAQLGAAIRRLRARSGKTLEQVAEATGSNKGTLSKIESGKQGVSLETLNRIAQALRVTIVTIFNEMWEPTSTLEIPAPKMYRPVPVYGPIQIDADGCVINAVVSLQSEGAVDYPAKGSKTYALRAKGESMAPRVRAGEFIVVEPDSPAQPGDDVVIDYNEDRTIVKQLLYERDGELTLGAINGWSKPITVSFDEVHSIQRIVAILPPGAFVPRKDEEST